MHIWTQPSRGCERWHISVYSTQTNFTLPLHHYDLRRSLPDVNERNAPLTATQRHTFGCTQTLCKGKYTQMVAQDTICFCWLAPRPLIKHGVGETVIADEAISKQDFDFIHICSFLFLHLCTLGLGHVEFAFPGVVMAHGMFTCLLIEF